MPLLPYQHSSQLTATAQNHSGYVEYVEFLENLGSANNLRGGSKNQHINILQPEGGSNKVVVQGDCGRLNREKAEIFEGK